MHDEPQAMIGHDAFPPEAAEFRTGRYITSWLQHD
jgi:hypothetical protein